MLQTTFHCYKCMEHCAARKHLVGTKYKTEVVEIRAWNAALQHRHNIARRLQPVVFITGLKCGLTVKCMEI